VGDDENYLRLYYNKECSRSSSTTKIEVKATSTAGAKPGREEELESFRTLGILTEKDVKNPRRRRPRRDEKHQRLKRNPTELGGKRR